MPDKKNKKDEKYFISLSELAEKLGLKLVGDGGRKISSVGNPLSEKILKKHDVIYAVWDDKALLNLDESVMIIAPERLLNNTKRDGLICERPREILPELLKIFVDNADNNNEKLIGINETARVSPDAFVDKTAWIGAFAVIEAGAVIKAGAKIYSGVYVGKNSVIGNNTVIEPRAVLMHNVKVGKNCLLHAGCVIGCDGFGFTASKNGPVKIPQIGGVTIGDDVEVGACTTIDRGTIDDTIIGSGTKIDNHVQIGHNVKIGKNCIICSMSGIAGSSVLEDGVILSVQAGITDHVKIGAGAILAARAGVTKDVPAGAVMSGYPLQPHNDSKRCLVLFSQLPDLFKRVRELEKILKLKNKNGN